MSRAYKITVLTSVILIVGAIAFLSPMDMDSFLSFSPIACRYYPLAAYHIFTLGCDGGLDLTLPGGIPWTRSAPIQGAVEAVLYFPLYLLMPYWPSMLVMNGVWYVGMIAAITYSTRISVWVVMTVLGANFYCAYTLLEDHQTSMQTAAVFLIPILARKMLQEVKRSRWLWYNALFGIVLFFCLELKLVFLYYLPIVYILNVFLNRDLIANVRILSFQLIWKSLPGICLANTLTTWLMNARVPSGQVYWKYIMDWGKHYPHATHFDQYLLHLWQLVTRYMLHFPNAAAIVYTVQDVQLLKAPLEYRGVLLTAPFWCIFVVTMVRYYRTRTLEPALSVGASQKIQGFFLAAGIGLLLISSQMLARHAFHLLPVMVCLFAAFAVALDYLQKVNKFPWVLAYILMASQVICTAYVVHQTPRDNYNWDRFDAIAFARQPQIAAHAVIVNVDWGTYYISALYGPRDQLVTYKYGLQELPELHMIMDLAKQQGRSIVIIKRSYSRGKFDEVQAAIPTLTKLYPLGKPGAIWEVWGEPPILDYLEK